MNEIMNEYYKNSLQLKKPKQYKNIKLFFCFFFLQLRFLMNEKE